MSESSPQPVDDSTAESDVESDPAQVTPAADSSFVGRVAGDDVGYAGEQGSEARAKGGAAADQEPS